MGAVKAAVIRGPLHRMRGLLIVKTSLCFLEHQVTDHLAGDSAGRGDPGHHVAITGIEREGDADALTVPAGDLDAIRPPSEVRRDRDDLTILSVPSRFAGVTLQQQSVLRHQSVTMPLWLSQRFPPCSRCRLSRAQI